MSSYAEKTLDFGKQLESLYIFLTFYSEDFFIVLAQVGLKCFTFKWKYSNIFCGFRTTGQCVLRQFCEWACSVPSLSAYDLKLYCFVCAFLPSVHAATVPLLCVLRSRMELRHQKIIHRGAPWVPKSSLRNLTSLLCCSSWWFLRKSFLQ